MFKIKASGMGCCYCGLRVTPAWENNKHRQLWSCHSQHRPFSGSPLPSKSSHFLVDSPSIHTAAIWFQLTLLGVLTTTPHFCEQIHQLSHAQFIAGFMASKYSLFSSLCLSASCAFYITQLQSLLFSEPWVMIHLLNMIRENNRKLLVSSLITLRVSFHLILKTLLQGRVISSTADSLEKTLMLEKIRGWRRRG